MLNPQSAADSVNLPYAMNSTNDRFSHMEPFAKRRNCAMSRL
jgi:hypothetical protein